jgi:hypothetical protein
MHVVGPAAPPVTNFWVDTGDRTRMKSPKSHISMRFVALIGIFRKIQHLLYILQHLHHQPLCFLSVFFGPKQRISQYKMLEMAGTQSAVMPVCNEGADWLTDFA